MKCLFVNYFINFFQKKITVQFFLSQPKQIMAKIPDSWKNVSMKIANENENMSSAGVMRKRKRKLNDVKSTDVENKQTQKFKTSDVSMQAKNMKSKEEAIGSMLQESETKCKQKCEQNILQLMKTGMSAEKLDIVLNNVSKNMQSIIGKTNFRKFLKGVDVNNVIFVGEIREVSKKYEDSYLRQVIHASERPCIRGENCECMFIDRSQPFVGCEYILPWETVKSKTAGMCLPCSRAATQVLFFEILQGNESINGTIQRFCNVHSKADEYDLSCMLVCPPNGPIHNLPKPIMRHQRNFYHVFKNSGLYYMKQVGVSFQ